MAFMIFCYGALQAAITSLPLALVWLFWSPALSPQSRVMLCILGGIGMITGFARHFLPTQHRVLNVSDMFFTGALGVVITAPFFFSFGTAVYGFFIFMPTWMLGRALGVTANVFYYGGPEGIVREIVRTIETLSTSTSPKTREQEPSTPQQETTDALPKCAKCLHECPGSHARFCPRCGAAFALADCNASANNPHQRWWSIGTLPAKESAWVIGFVVLQASVSTIYVSLVNRPSNEPPSYFIGFFICLFGVGGLIAWTVLALTPRKLLVGTLLTFLAVIVVPQVTRSSPVELLFILIVIPFMVLLCIAGALVLTLPLRWFCIPDAKRRVVVACMAVGLFGTWCGIGTVSAATNAQSQSTKSFRLNNATASRNRNPAESYQQAAGKRAKEVRSSRSDEGSIFDHIAMEANNVSNARRALSTFAKPSCLSDDPSSVESDLFYFFQSEPASFQAGDPLVEQLADWQLARNLAHIVTSGQYRVRAGKVGKDDLLQRRDNFRMKLAFEARQ